MGDQYWSHSFGKQFIRFKKQNSFIKEVNESYFRRAKILVMGIPWDVGFISSLQSWEVLRLLLNHSKSHTLWALLPTEIAPSFQNYQAIRNRYLLLFKISFKNYEGCSFLEWIQDFLVFASGSFQ